MHDATLRGRTQAGNAVELLIEWHDMAGEPEAPIAVVYEVFERGGAAISGSYATVPDPAAEMTIVVPGTALPGGTCKTRPLDIQVRATFGAGDTHTVIAQVDVLKSYAFSQ